MQQTQVEARKDISVAYLLLMGLMMLSVPVAWAAVGGAEIAGDVRDARGVAQMGALVQVFGADSTSVGTAFTDLRGRYRIPNLNSGKYVVRASATLFVPTTRPNLQLRTGATAVVNLTLAALFDTASWLPAERRGADESEEDWKWTLRSTANRPILRMANDGTLEMSLSEETTAAGNAPSKFRTSVKVGTGSFGASGTHTALSVHRSYAARGVVNVRTDVGTGVEQGRDASQEVEVGYGRRSPLGSASESRTVFGYKSHPELAARGAGLQLFEVTSAQRLSLGDRVDVEAGGRVVGVYALQYGFATYPFLHVVVRPTGSWTLQYTMASSTDLQRFEDVTTGQADIPVALMRDGRLSLEGGRHQEISAARRAGSATIQVAYYHDDIQKGVVLGGGAFASAGNVEAVQSNGKMIDTISGSFRVLGPGYRTSGARVTVSSPKYRGLRAVGEYSSGAALDSIAGKNAKDGSAEKGLRVHRSQSATVRVDGSVARSGTRVRASYRWQPSETVNAVDQFEMFSDQAFLGVMIRQPVHWGDRLPTGLTATIDVTNLLAEGYRPFVSTDGQTLYFAQAPRTIQAGLSLSF